MKKIKKIYSELVDKAFDSLLMTWVFIWLHVIILATLWFGLTWLFVKLVFIFDNPIYSAVVFVGALVVITLGTAYILDRINKKK